MVRSEKPIATSLLNQLKCNLKENGRLVKNEYLPPPFTVDLCKINCVKERYVGSIFYICILND
jgi:hypothetical protein